MCFCLVFETENFKQKALTALDLSHALETPVVNFSVQPNYSFWCTQRVDFKLYCKRGYVNANILCNERNSFRCLRVSWKISQFSCSGSGILGVFHQSLGRNKKSCDNKKYSKFNELKGRMSASRRTVTSHGAYSPYMDLVNIIGHDGNIS